MYRIEIVDQNEILITSHDYKEKKDCMIAYHKIKDHANVRYKLHGLIMQVFQGINENDLQELTKYRIDF